jgi:hypothetical protein
MLTGHDGTLGIKVIEASWPEEIQLKGVQGSDKGFVFGQNQENQSNRKQKEGNYGAKKKGIIRKMGRHPLRIRIRTWMRAYDCDVGSGGGEDLCG